jgi:formamidopyrimidine-DNA glycosylase
LPELPEVETVVRALRPLLERRRVRCVRSFASDQAAGSPRDLSSLAGRSVERLWRRGKFILADLSGGWTLAVHLRMTGWLGLVAGGEAGRGRHDRAVLELSRGPGAQQGRAGECLVFRDVRRFGMLWCGPRQEVLGKAEIAGLGPEPWAVGGAEFAERLRRRRGRVKGVLLDQEFLAGVGNIYADEALYRARLHPLRNAAGLSAREAARLLRAVRSVLEAAIAAGGTTVRDFRNPRGESGGFVRKLAVYGRAGRPCRRCGTAIRRRTVAQRGTWYCPKCPRAP